MQSSNSDRIVFLRERLNELAARIESSHRQDEYMSWLDSVQKGQSIPKPIDEIAWSVMLPAEQDANLISYYHTIRTELIEMTKKVEEPSMLDRTTEWLDSPWVKSALATATLIEAAKLLYHLFSQSGLFLRAPKVDEHTFDS